MNQTLFTKVAQAFDPGFNLLTHKQHLFRAGYTAKCHARELVIRIKTHCHIVTL